jgi:hypothetical protein
MNKLKIRSECKDKSYRQLKGKLNWYFATPFLKFGLCQLSSPNGAKPRPVNSGIVKRSTDRSQQCQVVFEIGTSPAAWVSFHWILTVGWLVVHLVDARVGRARSLDVHWFWVAWKTARRYTTATHGTQLQREAKYKREYKD